MATLVLNGTTYTLAYKPWRVIKRLHKEQGLDLLDLLADENASTRLAEPETLGVLLWGALIHEQPELTLEQAEDLLGLGTVKVIVPAIAEALKESLDGPGVSANPTT